MRSKKPPSAASESGRSWAPTIGCWMRSSPPIEPCLERGAYFQIAVAYKSLIEIDDISVSVAEASRIQVDVGLVHLHPADRTFRAVWAPGIGTRADVTLLSRARGRPGRAQARRIGLTRMDVPRRRRAPAPSPEHSERITLRLKQVLGLGVILALVGSSSSTTCSRCSARTT